MSNSQGEEEEYMGEVLKRSTSFFLQAEKNAENLDKPSILKKHYFINVLLQESLVKKKYLTRSYIRVVRRYCELSQIVLKIMKSAHSVYDINDLINFTYDLIEMTKETITLVPEATLLVYECVEKNVEWFDKMEVVHIQLEYIRKFLTTEYHHILPIKNRRFQFLLCPQIIGKHYSFEMYVDLEKLLLLMFQFNRELLTNKIIENCEHDIVVRISKWLEDKFFCKYSHEEIRKMNYLI